MNHKSRKRFGFVDYAWWTSPERNALGTLEERFRQRQVLAMAPRVPRAGIVITGPGA